MTPTPRTRHPSWPSTLPREEELDTASFVNLTSAARPLTATAQMPTVGETLGKYRLTGILGQGSSCRVYRGEHTRLPLAVAVKVFEPAAREDPAVLRLLRHEAALLAGLNHPNIIRLWDFDDDGPYPYLVTELVDGRTLKQLIEEGGRLLPDWALFLMLQLVDGLEAAVKVGVVHRDVKPGNILLTRDGVAKLADLGLAVVVKPTKGMPGVTASGSNGEMVGTAAYMAPEQASNSGPVDHRADIYSLGATLYHMVCGKLPFAGRNTIEVIFKHIQQSPTPPRDVVPGLPAGLSDLILKMMAKAPAERFQTYDELRARMKALLEAD